MNRDKRSCNQRPHNAAYVPDLQFPNRPTAVCTFTLSTSEIPVGGQIDCPKKMIVGRTYGVGGAAGPAAADGNLLGTTDRNGARRSIAGDKGR
jgi:hypothetical protein